jgi:hypothetical protein
MKGEIISYEWNKNCTLFAVLCKVSGKAEWFLKLYDLTNIRYIKQSNLNVDDPFKNKFVDMSFSWLDEIILLGTKYITDKVDTLNIFPVKIERKDAFKTSLWNKDKFITNVKASQFLPSSNGVHILLICNDPKNSNNFGKVDLYSIVENTFSKVVTFDYGRSFNSICWDPSGRFFLVDFLKEGFKVIDCQGKLIKEYKDNKYEKVFWRPRHTPILDQIQLTNEILKDMKNITRKYEEIDVQFMSKIEMEQYAMKRKVREGFMNIVNRRREQWNKTAEDRNKIKKPKISIIVEAEYTREEIIRSTEEIMKSE